MRGPWVSLRIAAAPPHPPRLRSLRELRRGDLSPCTGRGEKQNHSRSAARLILPREAGRNKQIRSRDAPWRPSHATTKPARRSFRIRPRQLKGAERRQAHPTMHRATYPDVASRTCAGADAAHADKCTQSASLICFGDRSPFGAPPRHSPGRSQPALAQLQTRAS